MARTSVTSQKVSRTGLTPVLSAPAGVGAGSGDIIDAGYSALMVECGATPTTVTVESPYGQDGLVLGPLTVTCAANETTMIGPFPLRSFAQTTESAASPSDVGRVYVDYSSVATVTRAVLAFGS